MYKEPLSNTQLETMKATLLETGRYFGIDIAEPITAREWTDYATALQTRLERPEELVGRLRRSAEYIQHIEEHWERSRLGERQAKVEFLRSLIDAVLVCLPSVSEPMIGRRDFIPATSRTGYDEEREHVEQRGLVLLDGWRRHVTGAEFTGSDAGRSLVLLEDGGLAIMDHTASVSDNGYTVESGLKVCTIPEALSVFNRKAFSDIVSKIVSTIWDLAHNSKRKEQSRESDAIADKLSALRVLIQRD